MLGAQSVAKSALLLVGRLVEWMVVSLVDMRVAMLVGLKAQ